MRFLLLIDDRQALCVRGRIREEIQKADETIRSLLQEMDVLRYCRENGDDG